MKTLVTILSGVCGAVLIAALFCFSVRSAQAADAPQVGTPTPGKQVPQTMSQEKNGKQLNYMLFLPKDYSATADKKWPVIVFLHGIGERGNSIADINRVKVHGPAMLADKDPDFKFIVATPQCPRDSWWAWDIDLLNAFLDDVLKNVKNADPNRVYLTGLSMGGFGTFAWSIRNPERFAAVAPICGGGTYVDSLALDPERREKLNTLAFWIFHGESDTTVLVECSRVMEKGLKSYGVKEVKLTTYPGVNHNSWTQTYNNPELYEWFLKHHR